MALRILLLHVLIERVKVFFVVVQFVSRSEFLHLRATEQQARPSSARGILGLHLALPEGVANMCEVFNQTRRCTYAEKSI